MLPYLNKIKDYSFLRCELDSLMRNYLSSLIQHIKDINGEVDIGFMIFSLKYNPSCLPEII